MRGCPLWVLRACSCWFLGLVNVGLSWSLCSKPPPPLFVYRTLLWGIQMNEEVPGCDTKPRGGGGEGRVLQRPPPAAQHRMTDSYQL